MIASDLALTQKIMPRALLPQCNALFYELLMFFSMMLYAYDPPHLYGKVDISKEENQ